MTSHLTGPFFSSLNFSLFTLICIRVSFSSPAAGDVVLLQGSKPSQLLNLPASTSWLLIFLTFATVAMRFRTIVLLSSSHPSPLKRLSSKSVGLQLWLSEGLCSSPTLHTLEMEGWGDDGFKANLGYKRSYPQQQRVCIIKVIKLILQSQSQPSNVSHNSGVSGANPSTTGLSSQYWGSAGRRTRNSWLLSDTCVFQTREGHMEPCLDKQMIGSWWIDG